MFFEALPLAGAFRISLDRKTDERGYFARRFCAGEFLEHGLQTDFVQRSVSYNHLRGTLRGLHFQAFPHIETKIVRCSRGAAYDVMVDMRPDSPSFGHWHGETISADNQLALYIPAGFAHGFQTLEDGVQIEYDITPAYAPGFERGIRFDDGDIGIDWPIQPAIVSDRDRSLPAFRGMV